MYNACSPKKMLMQVLQCFLLILFFDFDFVCCLCNTKTINFRCKVFGSGNAELAEVESPALQVPVSAKDGQDKHARC